MLLSDQRTEKPTREEEPGPPAEGRPVSQCVRAPGGARSGVRTPPLGTWLTNASPALPRGVCDKPPTGSRTNDPQRLQGSQVSPIPVGPRLPAACPRRLFLS